MRGSSWTKDVSIFDFGIIHNAAMVDKIGNEALNLLRERTINLINSRI